MTSPKVTVYLLNNGGSYSDYGVLAIFSNREAAEHACKRVGGEIEEYVLYNTDPRRHTTYVIERMGDSIREYQLVQEGWDPIGHYDGHMARGVGIGNYRFDFYRRWGLDKERVHKAFHDYDAQVRAKAAGIADG